MTRWLLPVVVLTGGAAIAAVRARHLRLEVEALREARASLGAVRVALFRLRGESVDSAACSTSGPASSS